MKDCWTAAGQEQTLKLPLYRVQRLPVGFDLECEYRLRKPVRLMVLSKKGEDVRCPCCPSVK